MKKRKSGSTLVPGTLRLRKEFWEAIDDLASAAKRKRGDWLRVKVEELVEDLRKPTASAA